MKQIKPCVENDILKIVTGQSINELTDETLFAANDAFMKRGTTVKLVPSSQKGFYFVFTLGVGSQKIYVSPLIFMIFLNGHKMNIINIIFWFR